ncbi:Wzz/FepE/Etk N-terminal domain-containing protein [Photobacterium carnosum]|uniref:Wzz/FepE/Etk N-terminal domain-containing protein n=1 Tax=Photobacterium carnosum TaxID=2023717 RepID=UPI001E3ABBE8|nr:Wzz/FepE/Etk N-terminal domain-containing protein [Photobacterium carnosum]MCD9535862.1 hypothetical protein [Photobacterium carnosum]MCF2161224.1 hypothetical protein [Photobacterium carnosum]
MLLQQNIFIKNKKLMLSVLITFIFASIIIGLIKEKKWTSSAVITAVVNNENLELRKQLLPLLEIESNLNSYNKLKEIYSNNYLYKIFVDLLESNENKNKFIKLKNNSGLTLADITVNRNNSNANITLTTNNNKVSKDLLIEYVDFTKDNTEKYIVNEFNLTMLQFKSELKLKLKIENKKAINKISIEIKRLEIAYKIAKASNLNKSVKQCSQINILPVFLGTTVLKYEIKYLNNINDYEIIIPEIMSIKQNIKAVSNIKIATMIPFVFYEYQKKPVSPLTSNKPTFKIMVLFGIVFGVLASLLTVFIKEQVLINRSNKTRK